MGIDDGTTVAVKMLKAIEDDQYLALREMGTPAICKRLGAIVANADCLGYCRENMLWISDRCERNERDAFFEFFRQAIGSRQG